MKLRLTQFVVLLVFFLMGGGFYLLFHELNKDIETQSLQATEEVLVDTSQLLANQLTQQLTSSQDLIESKCRSYFSYKKDSLLPHTAKIHGISKQESNLNFYITNQAGFVIFDTNPLAKNNTDLSQANDVYLTLKGQYGARSTRAHESDSNSSILYVGAPIIFNDETIGVLSVYKPQQDVLPFIEERKNKVLHVSLLIGSGTTLFIIAVFIFVYRPIGLLTTYVKSISEGGRPFFPKLGKGREINLLGNALTRKVFLNNINQEITRSQQVIDRLLQLSRIEQLDELKRQETINLKDIITKSLKEISARLSQKGIQINTDLQEITFIGDSFLIQASLQNLFDNAVKYTPKQGCITISTSKKTESVNMKKAAELA